METNETSKCSIDKQFKKHIPKSIVTTLWEIIKVKEEAKDRRLKEKLDFLKSLFDQKM